MTKRQRLVIQGVANRWGEGKVHFPRDWNSANAHDGLTLCGLTIYGKAVPMADHPVTCKKCVRMDHP